MGGSGGLGMKQHECRMGGCNSGAILQRENGIASAMEMARQNEPKGKRFIQKSKAECNHDLEEIQGPGIDWSTS